MMVFVSVCVCSTLQCVLKDVKEMFIHVCTSSNKLNPKCRHLRFYSKSTRERERKREARKNLKYDYSLKYLMPQPNLHVHVKLSHARRVRQFSPNEVGYSSYMDYVAVAGCTWQPSSRPKLKFLFSGLLFTSH